jgi:hypothetical protein
LGEFIRRPAIRWPVRACYGRVRDERAWFRNTGTWLVEEYLHVPRPASRGAGVRMDGWRRVLGGWRKRVVVRG